MKAREYAEKYKVNKKLIAGIRNDSFREEDEEELAKKLEIENEKIKENVKSLGFPYNEIVDMHYFRGLTLRIVASKLYYHYSYILKLKAKAEEMLEKKINEEEAV